MKNLSTIKSIISSKKGFTLIELLIVIAVLGVLAAVVLVAIDPLEQLSRGRDSGRKTSVGQLGRAMQAYYTAQGSYFDGGAWVAGTSNSLVATGEVRTFPTNPAFPAGVTVPCDGVPGITVGIANNFCYKLDIGAQQAVVYTRMESRVEINKGACAGVIANTWYVYSTLEGRSGTVCVTSPAQPQPNTVYTFL